MLNSRGQNINYVKNSVEENLRFEETLKKYIQKKYNIDLIKNKNQFKPYDFSYNKINKIEYKGLKYTLNDAEKTAVSVSNPNKKINNVFLSKSKIAYYKIRQMKNPLLMFYVVYGFYEIENNKVISIVYRYLNITDLDRIILEFKTIIHENSRHYIIPINDLERFPKENPFMNK